MFRLTAPHAQWPIVNDAIFEITSRAKNAIEKYGKENVINATIGSILDDEGKLVCLQTVFEELKKLPNNQFAEYSHIAGQADYLAKVEEVCFGEYKPNAFIKSIATPGGMGALSIATYNYTNPLDDILVADWFWTPYKTLAEENQRNITTFNLFDEDGNFDIINFEKNFNEILKKQRRILTILNTPAHNPTGYSISNDEWDKIIDILKRGSENEGNSIILVVDTAYIDYADEKRREFFEKFSDLPKNILVLIAFSLSKGYTMYGMRMGALIAVSSCEDVLTDFYYSAMHTARANWSNSNSSAMRTFVAIENSPEKKADYISERNYWKDVLQKRAAAFVEASKIVGLTTLPYRDGFFITIPHEKSSDLVEKLAEKKLFAVALKKGVRFAICAVNEETCRKCPKIIKETIDELL